MLLPVASLTFKSDCRPDLPGKAAAGGLRATEPGPGPHHRLWFDPRLRHHRIEWFAAGETEPKVRYVPAEIVLTWEPAEA